MSENCTNCKYFPKYNLGKISEKCGFSLEEFLVFDENGMWCGNYKKIDKNFEKQIIEAERKLNEIRFMKQSRSEAIPIEWLENYIAKSIPRKEHLPYWYKRNWNNRLRMMVNDWRKENESNSSD